MTEIRRRVLVEGVTKRQILRETGMHWTTLQKILTNSVYRRGIAKASPAPNPRFDRAWSGFGQILANDRSLPRQAAAYGQPHLATAPSRRLHGRLHRGKGSGA